MQAHDAIMVLVAPVSERSPGDGFASKDAGASAQRSPGYPLIDRAG